MSTKKIKKAAVRNFRIYEKGVERLKELEKELDSLDTRKFKKEEREIRKKLKDVTLIPVIEEDIKELKFRIAGGDAKVFEAKTDKRQDRKLNVLAKKEKEIEEKLDFHLPRIKTGMDILSKEESYVLKKLPTLSRKINFLRSKLEKSERLARKKELTEEDKENVSRIPALKMEILELREEEKNLGSKLPYLRNLINSLKKKIIYAELVALRKKRQLTPDQVREVKSLPELKRRINDLQMAAQKADARQEDEINFLNREVAELGNLVPALLERLSSAEEEVKALEERPKVPSLSAVKKRIGKLEAEIERPEFYKKKRFLKREVQRHFMTYEKGVERLKELEKELDSLDTRKFRREEKEIRKKLHEVSLIPEIEEDIHQLRLMIAGVDVRALESKTDKRQDRKLQGIKKELGVLIEQIKREAEKSKKISVLKKKTGFLSGIFKKEQFDIDNLSNRLDKNRLDFNDRLVREVAESRRISQAGDEELKNHLHELLVEVVKRMNKKNEESEKKLLERIKELEMQLEDEKYKEQALESEKIPKISRKTGLLRNLITEDESKISEIKSRIEAEKSFIEESVRNLKKEREESEKKILDEIHKLEEKSESDKKNLSQNFTERLLQVKKKIEESKKELEKNHLNALESLKKERLPDIDRAEKKEKLFEAEQKKEFEKSSREFMTFNDLGFSSMKMPDFTMRRPEIEQMPKPEPIEKQRLPSFMISPERFSSAVKQEVSIKEPAKLPKIKQEMPEEEKASEPKIPSKIFMTDEQFDVFYRNFVEMKNLISMMHDQVAEDVQLRKMEQKELFVCSGDYGEIRQKFAKLNSFFHVMD